LYIYKTLRTHRIEKCVRRVGRLDGPKYMSVVSQTEPQHDFAGTIYTYIKYIRME
jgi:hypothetical protein